MKDTILTVPAEVARPLREGLHTGFRIAAEQIAALAKPMGERSFEIYRKPLTLQDEARALLEEIGGETPEPARDIEVNLSAHRPLLLQTLEAQQRSYSERLADMDDSEQREATERVQELHATLQEGA